MPEIKAAPQLLEIPAAEREVMANNVESQNCILYLGKDLYRVLSNFPTGFNFNNQEAAKLIRGEVVIR